jgi:hypothetical protein
MQEKGKIDIAWERDALIYHDDNYLDYLPSWKKYAWIRQAEAQS